MKKEIYASKSSMMKHEKTEGKKMERKEDLAGIKNVIGKKTTKTLMKVKKK